FVWYYRQLWERISIYPIFSVPSSYGLSLSGVRHYSNGLILGYPMPLGLSIVPISVFHSRIRVSFLRAAYGPHFLGAIAGALSARYYPVLPVQLPHRFPRPPEVHRYWSLKAPLFSCSDYGNLYSLHPIPGARYVHRSMDYPVFFPFFRF